MVRLMRFIVREYLTGDGVSPYRAWLETLDVSARARVQARVLRFETGNLGDHRSVGAGTWEARLSFGPGYRIYFGRPTRSAVLLLLGGNKRSQSKDIQWARRYWAEYVEVTRHGKTE